MAPPAAFRYANEHSPDQEPAYYPPASRRTLGRRVAARSRDQKPAADATVLPQEPDIEWIPSFKTYRDRCLRRIKNGGLVKTLPEGFPAKLESPLAWEGCQLKTEEYIVELSAQEVAETETALRDFKCKSYWSPCFPLFPECRFCVSLTFRHFFPCAGCMKAHLS